MGAQALPGDRLDFRLLGPLEVWRKGRPLHLGGKRQRALLALLLLRPNGGRLHRLSHQSTTTWWGGACRSPSMAGGPLALETAIAQSPLSVRHRLAATFAGPTLRGQFLAKGDEAGIAEHALAVADTLAAAFAAPFGS